MSVLHHLPSKRLLVITDNRFWLNRLGSNARILAMLQHLQARGWAVRVAFCGHAYPQDSAAWMQQGWQVDHSLPALPMPATSLPAAPVRPSVGWRQSARKALRWLRAAASQGRRPRPEAGWWREVKLRAQARRVEDHADPRHAALVRELCSVWQPQAVLVEYVHLAWATAHIPVGTLRVIDTHDVQHERQQRFHAEGEVHGIDISATEEARWLSGFDVVVAIQRRDAQTLRNMLASYLGCRVITAMHPLPLQAPVQLPPGPLAVGFVGSNMAPNVRAARELLQEIWPRLLQHWPVAEPPPSLMLVGSVCDALRLETLPARAQLLGHVDNLRSVYAQLAVVVNPVRLGGGLKIKNIDALCCGKALLTTTVGAEGLEHGVDLAFRRADQPCEFVAQLLSLLLDAKARDALARSAFEFARVHFHADQVYAELDDALQPALRATSLPEGSG